MDDPALVRRLKRLRDLLEDRQRVVRQHRPAGNPFGQRLARYELHLEERRVADFLEAVQRGDVGMIERGEHPRLALEPAAIFGVVGGQLVKHLDGDFAAKPDVLRAIDLAHAARPKGRKDPVRTYGATWRQPQLASLTRIIQLRRAEPSCYSCPHMTRRLELLVPLRMLGLACAAVWLHVTAIALGMQGTATQRPAPAASPAPLTQLDLSVREILQNYSTEMR